MTIIIRSDLQTKAKKFLNGITLYVYSAKPVEPRDNVK